MFGSSCTPVADSCQCMPTPIQYCKVNNRKEKKERSLKKKKERKKKVGKTTRPFMYDLNQTPYDYTVEVRNRFRV